MFEQIIGGHGGADESGESYSLVFVHFSYLCLFLEKRNQTPLLGSWLTGLGVLCCFSCQLLYTSK